MKLLEATQIAPANPAAAELTLPVTFMDTFWCQMPPVERLFFYKIPGLDRTRFNHSLLPNLKHSLALALDHYLPLAGNILRTPNSPKPFLQYLPGDAVNLSVHESAADFHLLSGDRPRESAASRVLSPKLSRSDLRASVIALTVTLFPNSGVCVGISANHSVLDGKSTTLFLKSWAHICNKLVNGSSENSDLDLNLNLPPELSPAFDRSAIESIPEARGVDALYLRQWEGLRDGKRMVSPDIVSATFVLSPADIERLRNRVMKTEHSVVSGSTRPSTFVLSTAYAMVNNLKAVVKSVETKVVIAFTADYRARIDPPVPANYIGNCAMVHYVEVEVEELTGPDGFLIVAAKVGEAVRDIERGVLRNVEDRVSETLAYVSKYRTVGIAGSNRFGVYGVDFGWGRPEKVAVQSTEMTGAISMAESRDGSGGVEIGVVLTKLQMQHFQGLFEDGLKSP